MVIAMRKDELWRRIDGQLGRVLQEREPLTQQKGLC